jgi:hypothetical protein
MGAIGKVLLILLLQLVNVFSLLLTERGADQSAHELSLGRSVALFLSKLLSSSDQIGVVTLSNVPELVEPDINKKCSIDKLLPVSMSTKSFIERHLNRIHHTNDVSKVDVISGFMAALKMVEKSNLEKSESVQARNPSTCLNFLNMSSTCYYFPHSLTVF